MLELDARIAQLESEAEAQRAAAVSPLPGFDEMEMDSQMLEGVGEGEDAGPAAGDLGYIEMRLVSENTVAVPGSTDKKVIVEIAFSVGFALLTVA